MIVIRPVENDLCCITQDTETACKLLLVLALDVFLQSDLILADQIAYLFTFCVSLYGAAGCLSL